MLDAASFENGLKTLECFFDPQSAIKPVIVFISSRPEVRRTGCRL
jgi:hypothetical protein